VLGLELTDQGLISLYCVNFRPIGNWWCRATTAGHLLSNLKGVDGLRRENSALTLPMYWLYPQLEPTGNCRRDLRAALNTIATVGPAWLRAWVPGTGLNAMGVQWMSIFYLQAFQLVRRMPKPLGDGMELLITVWAETSPAYLVKSQRLKSTELGCINII